MAMQHPDRRHILGAAGAGLVAAAGLGGSATARPRALGRQNALAGGWLITRHDEGARASIRGVLTLADGGAFVGVDIEPTAPPYLGTWELEGHDGFVATFWTAITDAQGKSVGTARIKAKGHVDGDRMSGTYTAVIFVQGQEQPAAGTFFGSRIDAD